MALTFKLAKDGVNRVSKICRKDSIIFEQFKAIVFIRCIDEAVDSTAWYCSSSLHALALICHCMGIWKLTATTNCQTHPVVYT